MSEKISFVEWVAEREQAGETKASVADAIGVKLASLYRYLANDRVPDRDTMQRILKLSGNRVDVASFYAATEPERGAA